MTDKTKYHKIQTMFLRDPDNNYKTLLKDQWALSEFELQDRHGKRIITKIKHKDFSK